MDPGRSDGERVTSMRRAKNNSEIAGDEILSVASCVRPFDKPGVLCSGEGFTDVEALWAPGGKERPPITPRWSKQQSSAISTPSGVNARCSL